MATTYTSDDLMKFKVADLKKLLKAKGLTVSGSKSELIERLVEAGSTNGAGDATEQSVSGAVDDDTGDDSLLNEEEEEDDEEVKEETIQTPEQVKTPPVQKTQPPVKKIEAPETVTTHKVTFAKITPPEPATEDKKPAMSEIDKLALRAQKFGGSVSEEAKKKLRADKFGVSADPKTAEVKAGAPVKVASSSENLDKLKTRAERFGTTTSTTLSKVASDEAKRKRAERFGITSTTTATVKGASAEVLKTRAERFGTPITAPGTKSPEEQEKLLKRKERFGAITAVGTADVEERKRMRLEKFGTS